MASQNPTPNNPTSSSASSDQPNHPSALAYAGDPSPEQAASLPTIELAIPDASGSYQERCRQALLLAEEAFAKTGSWVVFFRSVLGVGGVVQTLFQDSDERRRFVESPEHATLHEMLAAVRSQDTSKSNAAEPERMITIRIPKSLHELLVDEAKGCNLSINKLCISKLLQPANDRFIPEQQGRRRGRRPGPQTTRSQQEEALSNPNHGAPNPPQAGRVSGKETNSGDQDPFNQVSIGRFNNPTPPSSSPPSESAAESQSNQPGHSWGG